MLSKLVYYISWYIYIYIYIYISGSIFSALLDRLLFGRRRVTSPSVLALGRHKEPQRKFRLLWPFPGMESHRDPFPGLIM